MRKTAGFTLIELVIVIVILGILGAVAAPRFLNLQGDAYGANVKSLAGSLQTAATLANTKAILEGKDNVAVAGTTTDQLPGYEGVAFAFGYPTIGTNEENGAKWQDGILGALQSAITENDYTISGTGGVLTIQPKARDGNASKCFVKYTQATDGIAAKVQSEADCD
ncbi:MAG: type II secretion system protein [Gammaproteobacteria bacterium]|nr:type II secretion system protein [Gammaproteobacteria bacterium]